MKLKFRTPWFLYKNENPTENDSHSVDPSSVNPFERKKLKAACALNMCMVSLSQIVDYQNLEVLKMEYDSILNNLNLETVVKDEALLKALQAIMDACHFYILHARDKEILKKKQQARLKGALGNALGGGNVIAIFGSGNPWAIAAGAAAMIGVAAVNYKSQRDKAKLENEIDEWQLERSALEQLHNLRRTLFETAWHFAEKYNYPDSYRLTEKQISVYNDIIRNPDPQTRYESLWLIRDNFKAYPMFWYYLGRAALETSDAFRPDANAGERKRQIAYGAGDRMLQEAYRKKAIDAYETFKKCHLGNELMREDVLAASAYLDHAQLCDPAKPLELYQIFDDVNRAYKLAPMDEEVVQSCAFRYLQLFELSGELKDLHSEEGRRLLSDEDIASIPKRAVECLRFLMNRDFNAEVNGRALSRLYKLTDNHSEYLVVKSMVSRRCPLVYQCLFPWDAESFKEDWRRYLNGSGIKTTVFNLFYGYKWMSYKDFLLALRAARMTFSYAPLKSFRDEWIVKFPDEWEKNLCVPVNENLESQDKSEDNANIQNDDWDNISHAIKNTSDVLTAIQSPVLAMVRKCCEHKGGENVQKESGSLEGLMLKLLDESYERIAWKLFLGTRASTYIPSAFEMSEKKLMQKLISDAKSETERFIESFRSLKDVSEIHSFGYEEIAASGCDASEPVAFLVLSCIERMAERMRQEIQDLLGGESRFWYPDPKFLESTLRRQSQITADEIASTQSVGQDACRQVAVSYIDGKITMESLTDDDIDDALENGVKS